MLALAWIKANDTASPDKLLPAGRVAMCAGGVDSSARSAKYW
jgi:hypothetical protein